MMEDAASILENRRTAYLQGDSSLLDYLMSVRVYNDTAEQCIAAKAGLTTAAAELLRTRDFRGKAPDGRIFSL